MEVQGDYIFSFLKFDIPRPFSIRILFHAQKTRTCEPEHQPYTIISVQHQNQQHSMYHFQRPTTTVLREKIPIYCK